MCLVIMILGFCLNLLYNVCSKHILLNFYFVATTAKNFYEFRSGNFSTNSISTNSGHVLQITVMLTPKPLLMCIDKTTSATYGCRSFFAGAIVND